MTPHTLTIDAAADRYSGFPRPVRRLQKCARGDLECLKVETSSGEYIIKETSDVLAVPRGALTSSRMITSCTMREIDDQDEGDSAHPAGCFESGCIDHCGI
jgi:hypothetical protein